MGRRKKCRRVDGLPAVTFFKPQGVPLAELKGVVVEVEGLEALRLVDAEGLSQEEAAARMRVSRPTLCRILGAARGAVARALSKGWSIRVEGGDYALESESPEREDLAADAVQEEDVTLGSCEPQRRCCGRMRENT